MVVTLTLIYRFINQLSTIDQVKSLSIVEEDCPDKRLKGLKACLQWKVYLASSQLQTLHSNTQKQIIQIQHNRMMVEKFPLVFHQFLLDFSPSAKRFLHGQCCRGPASELRQIGQCCWLDLIKSAKSLAILAIQLVKVIRRLSFLQVLCRLLFWGLVSYRRMPNTGQPLLLKGGVQGSSNRECKICAYSFTNQSGTTSGPQAFARFTLHKTL